ncbi:hypothetical protein KAU33_17160 [Candidatus Dependentiae bacterium]|nr:hypothetical protein [Candidatus Dependentiae bacterium]
MDKGIIKIGIVILLFAVTFTIFAEDKLFNNTMLKIEDYPNFKKKEVVLKDVTNEILLKENMEIYTDFIYKNKKLKKFTYEEKKELVRNCNHYTKGKITQVNDWDNRYKSNLITVNNGESYITYEGGRWNQNDKVIYFLNGDGTVIKEINLGYYGYMIGRLSFDNSIAVFLYEITKDHEVEKVILQAFDVRGNELWKKEFKDKFIGAMPKAIFTVSSKGNYIIFILLEVKNNELFWTTYIIDKKGNFLKTIEKRYLSIISSNEKIAGFYNDNEIFVFNLLENKKLYSVIFPTKATYIIEYITENGNDILISEVYSDKKIGGYVDNLYLLSINEKLIRKCKLKRLFYTLCFLDFHYFNNKIIISIDDKPKVFEILE